MGQVAHLRAGTIDDVFVGLDECIDFVAQRLDLSWHRTVEAGSFA